MLEGKKILITGATGQVARPIAEALAKANEVWCIARFGQAGAEQALRDLGIRTRRWDMARAGLDDRGGLDGLPGDFTHVLHAAAYRGDGRDFDDTVQINATGVSSLMMHCRRAEAFLYVSSGALYSPPRPLDHPIAEDYPLGGQTPWLPTYPVSKLAAEAVARALAVTLGLPTTIARLNLCYGPYGHGGMPILLFRRMLAGQAIEVPPEGQNWCSPIHTDDVVRQAPLLCDAATVPARVVNWAGDDRVGIQDMLTYMAELTGIEARFTRTDAYRATSAFDNTRRTALIGPCQVGWRDGIRATLQALFPDLVRQAADVA